MRPYGPIDICPCFPIPKLSWNLTYIVGDNALTQTAHYVQHEGTPCTPFTPQKRTTEPKEVTACILVLS